MSKRCSAIDHNPACHAGNPECRCVFPEGHYRPDYPEGHERAHYCHHGNWELKPQDSART